MRFCIILGAMKAGTTSLFKYLAQHPQIAPCNEKEPSYFCYKNGQNIEEYLKLWKEQDLKDKVLMEASTNYTKYPAFPGSSSNILDFAKKNPVDLKFVYVMRKPIERVLSQYTYSYARWISDSLDERIEHGHIINVSRYAMQLDQYFNKFNRENFLLLPFEDLKNKPDELLKQVCKHLGIDDSFNFEALGQVHNKSEGRIITRPVDKIYKKYSFVKSFAKLFPKRFRRWLSRILFRKRIEGNFSFSAEQKQRVYNELKEDMNQLRDKYDIEFLISMVLVLESI